MYQLLILVFLPFSFYTLFSIDAIPSTTTEQATLIVDVEGLRNNDGSVGLALFNNADTFPAAALQNALVKPDSLHARFVLEDIPYGTYALSVLHDENDNQQMERNDLGMPTEGFGFSNNPTINFGPPAFSDVEFTVDSDTLTLRVRLLYF